MENVAAFADVKHVLMVDIGVQEVLGEKRRLLEGSSAGAIHITWVDDVCVHIPFLASLQDAYRSNS